MLKGLIQSLVTRVCKHTQLERQSAQGFHLLNTAAIVYTALKQNSENSQPWQYGKTSPKSDCLGRACDEF